LALLSPMCSGLGLLLVLSTMRARSGFRGPHEWLSGTQVIQLPTSAKRQLRARGPTEPPLLQAAGLPAQLGSYLVHGLLCEGDEEQVLVAEDPVLERRVWLWLRPATRPPLPETRRQLGRTTRLRWLG